MNILELFAGTASFSNVALIKRHKVFTSDFDSQFSSSYTINILDFDISKVPFKPDIIWASPPCESFSVASIGYHWNKDNTPKTKQSSDALKLIEKTKQIIKELNPKYYYIENPRGKLRKLGVMEEFKTRHTVTYCQYGDTKMKPTDIWTNNLSWEPRPICKNGDPCHSSAPRGSRTGTQGIKLYKDKSRIPKELCEEILEASYEV